MTLSLPRSPAVPNAVLVFDSCQVSAESIAIALDVDGHAVYVARRHAEARILLEGIGSLTHLIAYRGDDEHGGALLRHALEVRPALALIVLSSMTGVSAAPVDCCTRLEMPVRRLALRCALRRASLVATARVNLQARNLTGSMTPQISKREWTSISVTNGPLSSQHMSDDSLPSLRKAPP